LSQLKKVRRLVEDVAHEALLDEDRIFDLKVAVSEACANAIEHPDAKAELRLRAWLDRDSLHVEVTHPGEFRVRKTSCENGGHRGLGLPLMVSLMDEVKISRGDGAGTRVELSVFLH
jgi:serine/threonine-protein kinase RsbW